MLVPQRVAMERILDVDAGSAVDVLAGVGDEVRLVGGKPLGDAQVFGGVESVGETPECGVGGQPYGFDVDVAIGQALRDSLERSDRSTELLTLCGVLRGEAQLTIGDPGL